MKLNLFFNNKSGGGQKGVSLYLALMVMIILLAIVLGITTILVSQIKMIRGMGDSVVALYAADTGVERVMEAVRVGYDHYDYPTTGICEGEDLTDPQNPIPGLCQCNPTIIINTGCGLPSRCEGNNDCLCPTNKCIKYNKYTYPSGTCIGQECDCTPSISVNDSECEAPPACFVDSDCLCPADFCVGLEPAACPNPSCETGYRDTLANGASYKTYIGISGSINFIKSIGSYKGTKRAIELTY